MGVKKINKIGLGSKMAPPRYLSFDKADIIYYQDDPIKNVFKVIKGRVILRKDEGHKHLSIQIARKGDFIGVTELITNVDFRRCSAVALQDETVLQSFTKSTFNKLMEKDAEASALLLNQLVINAESAWQRFVNKKSFGIKKTVEKGLIELGTRDGVKKRNGLLIEGFSHEELANYLAISRQSVTTSLIQLRKEKKISYSRRRASFLLNNSLFLYSRF